MKIKEISRSRFGRVTGLLVVSLSLGALIAFRDISFSRQSELVKALFTIAPVIFGILGVWVAVLDPSSILNRKPSDQPTERTNLELEFSPILVVATFVFVGVILLRFASPLLPVEWFNNFWGKMIFGTLVSSLYVMEIFVLLMTLLPLTRVQEKDHEDTLRRRYRK